MGGRHYYLVHLCRLASAVGLLVILRLGFAVGLCFLAWLVVLLTLSSWVSWVLCHVLSWLVSSCVMLFICVMTFCRIYFISSVAFSLSLKYILYGVFAVVVLNARQFFNMCCCVSCILLHHLHVFWKIVRLISSIKYCLPICGICY